MKIFFLIRSLDIGGAEHQLVILAKNLYQRGHRIQVLTFYEGKGFQQDLEKTGIEVICLKKRGRWDMWSFFLRLARYIRKENPDILYSFLPVSNILSILLLFLGYPLKVVWGSRASVVPNHFYDFFNVVVLKIESIFSRFPHAIIINSFCGLIEMKRRGYKNKGLHVISNGIDVDKFYPDAQKRDFLRKKWGIGAQQLLLGHVGRADPIKDHPTFIQALALLKAKLPQLSVVCVGVQEGNYLESLKKMARDLNLENTLIWVGPQQEMDYVYNALDLFCSSSVSEGFSNVLAEAMSTGLPCITTDVGDAKLIVGDQGGVVPPQNPEALMEACFTLLTEKKLHSEQIRSRIVENFSINRMVENTETVLKGLC